MNQFARENPKAAIILPEVPPEKGPSYTLPEKLLEENEVVVVLGLGDGGWIEPLLPWLKGTKNHLVVLEENLSYIHHFLQEESPSDHLHIIAYGPFAPLEKVAENLSWKFAKSRSIFHSFVENRNAEETIQYEMEKTADMIDEYLKFGIVYYRNFYHNIRNLPSFYSGNHLFGKFKGIPAIICGAGPSLTKHLPLLESLKEHAIVFAGGSALSACANHGTLPHFGAGIDPNSLQLSRFSKLQDKKLPFFFRSRFHHPALDLLQGPKLYLNGAGGYDTARYMEEELGITGEEIDEGHNVVNFCTEIAHHMGCNPILFVGLDLAYTENSLYADGVIENPKLQETEHLVEKEDLYGNPVWTEWKWLKEADWLSEYQATHPELTLKNCTEGGIPIKGIENIPLAEAKTIYLEKEHSPLIESMIEEGRFTITKKQVEGALERLRESLHNCIEHLEVLLSDELGAGHKALAEVEIQEEPAFGAVLEMFSAIWNLSHSPDEGDKEKYLFLQRVAEANLILMREAAGKKEEREQS